MKKRLSAEENYLEAAKALAKKWFDYWIKNPDKINWMFNDVESPTDQVSHCYYDFVKAGIMMPLESLAPEVKKEIKDMVFQIAPKTTKNRGMKLARVIAVFIYLADQK